MTEKCSWKRILSLPILRYPRFELAKVSEVILLGILRCGRRALSVRLEPLRPLPAPIHYMAVRKGDAASVVVSVCGKVNPIVYPLPVRVGQTVVNYHGRIVDALFMFIDERKDIARVGDLGVLRFDIRVERG